MDWCAASGRRRRRRSWTIPRRGEARELELRKIDRVYREACEAWERSQKPSQSVVMTTDGSEQTTKKVVKEQHGDPRYLDRTWHGDEDS